MSEGKQTVREHIEDVAHKLLEAIERNIGSRGVGNPEQCAQYAAAVASLACWPNMCPLTTDDFRKLAEYEVMQAGKRLTVTVPMGATVQTVDR